MNIEKIIIILFILFIFLFSGCQTFKAKKTTNDIISNASDNKEKIQLININTLYKSLNTIVILSLAGASICLSLFIFTAKKQAIIGIIGCLISFLLSIISIYYLKYIALLSFMIVIGCVLYLAYIIFLHKKEKNG